MNSQRQSCPVCGESAWFRECGAHIDGAITYRLFECSACTVQFWEPLKNPGAEWYGHDERYSNRNDDPIRKAQWNHRKTISFFEKPARVLDVGCGVGNFLAHAKAHGWQVSGIDFDSDAIEAGKRAFGLEDLSVSDVVGYAASHSRNSFDLVTFFDVLEHVDNHREFLSAISSLLKPGGHIAMSMPCRTHAPWLMRADVPPRHLTKWDPHSLTYFLNTSGFDVIYIKRVAATIPFIIIKLRFMFGKKLSMNLVKRVKSKEGDAKKKTSRAALALVAAKIKDAILFGIPAMVLWVALLLSNKRYIGLYAIAKKR